MKRLMLALLATCAVAMAQPDCSMQTLRGTYVISYAGFVTTASGSTYVTILGVASIDPSQTPNISGGITFTGFGPKPVFVPASGMAQINPDCTGTLRLGNPTTGSTEIDQFIYDRDTKTILATVLKIALGNPASLGTWKMIFPIPNVVTWTAPPTQ